MIYYIGENGEQKGPFSLEELKEYSFTKDTLVWSEKLETWTNVKDVKDLSDIIDLKIVSPPPLPNPAKLQKNECSEEEFNNSILSNNEIIDDKYLYLEISLLKMHKNLISWGIGMFVLPIVYGIITSFLLFSDTNIYKYLGYFNFIYGFIYIIMTFCASYYSFVAAKEQNRKPISWGFIGLFAPWISLIILGNSTIIYSKKDKVKNLIIVSCYYFSKSRYKDMLRLAVKGYSIDNKSLDFKCLYLLAQYGSNKTEELKQQLRDLYSSNINKKIKRLLEGILK
ncbi:DUF4339 domain-containing protein [Marinilabiliaceae bacterium JC040]|nr:DUF4339 domain-containing protein [Marinilabiliaceae bacterium JC040]